MLSIVVLVLRKGRSYSIWDVKWIKRITFQKKKKRNGESIIVNKRVQNTVLGGNLKNDRISLFISRQTVQYHGNPSLCPGQ